MTPSVTQPPVVLDTVDAAVDDVEGAHFYGPFVIGSNQYAVLLSEPGSSPPFHNWLNVYKTTDGGLTWTSMDSANRPDTSQSFDVILNGTVFTIVYTASTIDDPLKIITFDTATDTFGVPSVDGPLTSGNARIAQFASGDLCIWYGGFTLGLQAAVIFSAGVWGIPVTIPASKNDARSIVMGANNVAQLFYFDIHAVGPDFFNSVFLRTFTNGGVMGAEQNVFTSPAVVLRSSDPTGRIVIWNGDFIVPAFGGTNNTQAGIWTGSPYTAPVWTFTLLDPTVQPPGAGDFTPFALVDSNNNLIVFWNTLNFGSPAGPVNMSYRINDGTGFKTAQILYDELTNPPLNPPLTFGPIDIFFGSVTRYANGKFGAIPEFCGCPSSQCIGSAFLIDGGAIAKRCLQ